MSRNDDIGYVVVFLGLGIWGFFWGFMRLRRKRMIENIPTSTVRGLALGLVELVGKAKRAKLFRSPLTGAECVMYRYLVERYERRGRSSTWVTVAKGDTLYCPFWLDDGTGKILVFPQSAELILPVDYQFTTGWGKTLPSNLSGFMDKHAIRCRGLFGNRTLRFREWYISPDDTVYVLGVAKKSLDYQADHKEKLMQRIRQLKDNAEKMKQIDLNKDGQISQEEWDSAVANLEQEILREEMQSYEGEDPADVILTKGDIEKIFIISDYSQKELVKKLSWQALGGVFGGAILALLMLAYLLSRLKLF